MDTMIMILRAVVGLLFIGHGTQKLFGWWVVAGSRGRPAVRSSCSGS
jgi:putative oxidoreductase